MLSTLYFSASAFKTSPLSLSVSPVHLCPSLSSEQAWGFIKVSLLPAAAAAAAAKPASVVSDSVGPHRWQPTRLHRPWDSPGKNTGVGCHFLLQCRKMKSEREVAQSCLTLRNPMDCSPPGFSVHEIFQARVLEWGASAFSESAS